MPTSPPTSTAVSQHSPDTSGDPSSAWRQVDEGWGRRAVDFATLSEPANCREYVALHHHLGVGPNDRLLDIACGAGLAVELATAVGATCSGIDASPRLIAVARDRNPHADLRVGDMQDLPWADASFDVVTSFRGIWGTTPGAVPEALPRAGARWPIGDHRLGSHQALPGGMGVGAAGAGERTEGGTPSGDGGAWPARSGRGVARPLRVRRHRASRDPLRLGIRRSRGLRPRHLVGRPGVRGHRERRRGGVHPVGDRPRPTTSPRRASAASADRGRRLRRPQTVDRQAPRCRDRGRRRPSSTRRRLRRALNGTSTTTSRGSAT